MDLRSTDPRHDKQRIENMKGGLLLDSCRWILDNNLFVQWRDAGQDRLLWIKGDPGKGKTMLLCSLIDELSPKTRLYSKEANTLISYFFCQATDARLNSANAVLRGLIYLLVKQQPSLIRHLRSSVASLRIGGDTFDGVNAWWALSEIFDKVMQELSPLNIYLIIDALDECITDIPLLLGLIKEKSSAYPCTRWIVSSRNWPSIEEHLDSTVSQVKLRLELNEESISEGVGFYIQHKVYHLANKKKYNPDTRDAVQNYLLTHAHGTFLWVALVCEGLEKATRWTVLSRLNEFPAGLDQLYLRMVDQISSSDMADYCKRILGIILTVYRPIKLQELRNLVEMPDGMDYDYGDEFLVDMIACCGSLITLRKDTIYLIHQSAKDFLLRNLTHDIFPSGTAAVHGIIFSQALGGLSKVLRRDIYGLESFGYSIEDVKAPELDPLEPVAYSSVFWISHLIIYMEDSKLSTKMTDLVEAFFQKKLLNWIESLALLREISHGITLLLDLETSVAVSLTL
jgi:hypothetical protein